MQRSGFYRARQLFFIILACLEITMAVYLVQLGRNLPREEQIADTFAVARRTGQRSVHTAKLLLSAMERVRKVPVVGKQVVEAKWINGMQQAIREVKGAVGDLDTYEQQTTFTCTTAAQLAWLLAAFAGLHGLYMVCVSCWGSSGQTGQAADCRQSP